MPHGDGLRRPARFPAKFVRRGKPQVAGGDQRLHEGLQGARLDEIRGNGVNVGLGGEPGIENGVGVRRAQTVRGQAERRNQDGPPAPQSADGQMGTKWYR